MSGMPCRDDPARIALVSRHRFRALVGTALDVILRTRGVEPVLSTGFTTETGVEPGLRDGLSREHCVGLVEDCAASCGIEAGDSDTSLPRSRALSRTEESISNLFCRGGGWVA